MIKDKRVLVVGGAGSIGSELVRQIAPYNKVYVLDQNESGLFDLVDSLKGQEVWGRVGDIRDYKTVRDVFEDFKPQIIFNCAAYKHVHLMEYTPLEAINTNVIGHYNLVHVAKTWECVEKFIFISTDKAVNSHSIMGATKRLSEIITLNQGKGYTVVRFGNVLHSRGSLMTIWERQLKAGKKLTVTDERMERYMMSIPQAVSLVLEATENGAGGEIFVMDMGEKVNIKKLAVQTLIDAKMVDPSDPFVSAESQIEMIGLRAGETLSEELMTQEERERSIRSGNFWIIK